MELLTKRISNPIERPIKVVQFGEGNFLRAFVDYMIDVANEKDLFDGSIVILKPIEFGSLEQFHKQECQYTLTLRGIQEGREVVTNRIISSVRDAVSVYEDYDKFIQLAKIETLRFVVSNTTEAGITYDSRDNFAAKPPKTYPAKLTKFLFERYQSFFGVLDKGLIILPVELIDDNGSALKACVLKYTELWNLENGFITWLVEACIFCNTLVDRIVTGYPKEEAEELCQQFGYRDDLLVTAEPFGLWVIESEKDISAELPLERCGLPVIFTNNQKPYKQRKVRILNGAHTSFVLASYLSGNESVLESMQDDTVRTFMTATIYEEVIPTLTLSKEELIDFANSVIERFENPFIKHALLSISLNSVSKWKARCLPSLINFIELYGELPKHLVFSIAALMSFYSGTELKEDCLIGMRDGEPYCIKDDREVLEFFASACNRKVEQFVQAYLSNESFHGQDLTALPGLSERVTEYLGWIRDNGMRKALEMLG
ncbi:MAG: altronate oxidoreductase [Herbinix sp.]|jgi:tagaturonate reductase|nr:altronate oxidoreductase [Herbinix sp.]